MALDLWYLRNASFMVDVQIVIATVRMVLFGETRNEEAINLALATPQSSSVLPVQSPPLPVDQINRRVA